MATPPKNGHLDLKFANDRTQVLATVRPPAPGGKPITVQDIIERLRGMSVLYGVREHDIQSLVHQVDSSKTPATGLVAQGTLTQDGIDGSLIFHIDKEKLQSPLPKNEFGLINWFEVHSFCMVKQGDQIANIIPPQPGTPGKTLTPPITAVPPRPGKKVEMSAGDNVVISSDASILSAGCDGCATLHRTKVTVHMVDWHNNQIKGGCIDSVGSLVLMQGAEGAALQSKESIHCRCMLNGCNLRARGIVYIENAEGCSIQADGDIYVTGSMINCEAITPGRIITAPGCIISGGNYCATKGMVAHILGDENFCTTEIQTGQDRISMIRAKELEMELKECEASIARIKQSLRSCTAGSVQATRQEQFRTMVQTLQEQMHLQDERIREIHSERRKLALNSRCADPGTVKVVDRIHPGVWIRIASASLLVESPQEKMEYTLSGGGKSVLFSALKAAA